MPPRRAVFKSARERPRRWIYPTALILLRHRFLVRIRPTLKRSFWTRRPSPFAAEIRQEPRPSSAPKPCPQKNSPKNIWIFDNDKIAEKVKSYLASAEDEERAHFEEYYGEQSELIGGIYVRLRHTFISRCKEAGVLSEVVSIWAGRSLSGTITSTVYTHYSEEFQLKEAEKVVY